jgi:hypothetical protein
LKNVSESRSAEGVGFSNGSRHHPIAIVVEGQELESAGAQVLQTFDVIFKNLAIDVGIREPLIPKAG